jgi:hypothetical protein
MSTDQVQADSEQAALLEALRAQGFTVVDSFDIAPTLKGFDIGFTKFYFEHLSASGIGFIVQNRLYLEVAQKLNLYPLQV